MLCVKVSYIDYYVTTKEHGSETIIRIYGTKINTITKQFEEKTLIHLHGLRRYFYFTLTETNRHKKLQTLEDEINNLLKSSYNVSNHYPILPLKIETCKSIYGYSPNKHRVVRFN